MKKLAVLTNLLFLITAFFGLISCNDDHSYEPTPVKMQDVNGNYKARLITSQGGKFNEKVIDFEAKDSIITFKEFPVREIVKTIITDPAKAETALSNLGKIEYKLNYKSKINLDQNVIELTFEPKTLAFQIAADGITKDIAVELVAKQKGFFVGYDWSVRFGLEAEKITIDGVELSPYQTIKYDIPVSVKY